MSLLHLNDSNFKKEVLESELPVLVDFWAPWCGPCKMIAPVLEELTSEYQGRIKVGKVNIDENSGVATQYAVMSIPTIMFFSRGKVVDQVVGVLSKSDLKGRIEEAFI
ncbi:MAG: thioredoxin [Candidatus Omnitrophota bacterium]